MKTSNVNTDDVAKSLIHWSWVWKLDGDLVECHKCGRKQHVTYINEVFPHKGDCQSKTMDCLPWKDLGRCINEVISIRGATL